MYKLYVIYSTKDFKVKYVGITKRSTEVRLKDHLKNIYRLKTYKDKWMISCLNDGYDIRIKTVRCCNTSEEVNLAEINLISYLLSKNYKLTNSTAGGDGILNPSNDVRKKISESRKRYKWTDESRLKLSNSKKGTTSAKGCKWSDEAKAKQSLIHKGRPSYNKVSISEFTKDNQFVKRWNSISEAANYHNILVSSIANNLKGTSKTCNNLIFKYNEDTFQKIST